MNKITDSKLYQKCKLYGSNARLWMRKFEGLIPEVYKRRLYKRRGFVSIHEFAAKLAGMSRIKVDRILQIARKLEDKPKLKRVFEQGKAPLSKVAQVAYVAKPETDEMWAEKVQNESQLSLKQAVKQIKSVVDYTFKTRNKLVVKTVPEHNFANFSKLSFSVSRNCERKFRALKQRFEQETGEALSYGEVLKKLLDGVESEEQKAEIKICPDCAAKKAQKSKSRTAPKIVKQLVFTRQNNKCAKQGCVHPPSELHHKNGYALTKNHSPNNLEYLCINHHKLEHIKHEFVQIYRRE